ncbi:MAG: ArgE/DapE family deacylase [Actinobacteria bacterium]|nr:ArgE/DapE family deacylase [Actinomycetota bacterium]
MQDIEKTIISEVDKRKDELIDYLKKLISFPSENEGLPGTGKETEMQNFIYDDLKKSQFDNVEKISLNNSGDRPNIVGTLKGYGKENSLILNAHADVVPVREEEKKKWFSDPYKAVIKEDKLYGRGSSDCKGGLASIIIAAKILKDLGIKLNNDLYVVSSIGEESQEGETIGAALVAEKGYKAKLAVIAEPSNCEIHIESPGVFFFELKIKGKEAHPCVRNQMLFPQRYGLPSGSEIGVDAIDKAIPFIKLMQNIEIANCHRWKTATLSGGGYPVPLDKQGLGLFTITPTKMKAGEYIGAVCGHASIIFVVWYPNWLKEEEVAMEIKEKVMHLAKTDDWLVENPPEFVYPTLQHWRPFKNTLDNKGVKLLGETLEEIQKKQVVYSAFRAVCDGTFFQDKGIPSVVFGPGGIDMSVHGPNEYVVIDEVIKCAKIYALFTYRWCNKS